LIARRGVSEHVIRQRIERGIAEGDVPKNEDAAKLATYLATLLHGMAVEAASGATEQQLNGIVDIVMRSWPEVSAQAA
jgi:hypothetical protein